MYLDATLERPEQADVILDYLNTRLQNITFTIELKIDGRIPFLDVTVIRCSGKYISSVYKKPAFKSLTAIRYKLGLIGCLAETVLRMRSEPNDRMMQLEKLKQIMYKNG